MRQSIVWALPREPAEVHLDVLDYLAAAGAGGAAGAINALAGGGTLVSFSTLVGLGVPPSPPT